MPLFKVGEIVRVAARTWPGMNKQGGVGKVINVNDDAGTVDVKYVLGGRERKIEFKFVNTNAFGDSCNAGIGDGTFETAEEKEFSKRILEVKNERKSDKDHSPLRIYSEGILEKNSPSENEMKSQNISDEAHPQKPTHISHKGEKKKVQRSALKKLDIDTRTIGKPEGKNVEKCVKAEDKLKNNEHKSQQRSERNGSENAKNKKTKISSAPQNEGKVEQDALPGVTSPGLRTHECNVPKAANTIEEKRQDQFLSLLNKAMNSDSARFCDIVNLSNSENLKFSAVEIRSALEDLHSNGIIFFHDAEDVVYSI
uniref:MCM3-like winged helix domain-containing protein n=4 Tax=Corethron hystrix TaxID=216773 RepID=A0A7S1B8S8_9STRA|mmetsp:Transcript_15894/g.35802  ORF Transcript_15894/g.35802 Transcript_15894/m.35802 type:complete len:311 (+) Transcript_15894:158-1090(+)|eukprot:CAMPEP_0113318286 /NCGR_PEP_ID=MMETSP0010_2-20120614/12898_1 /TAXON_ID=216773 ORGANISM="Corethron hystrix, Strain 308" /NCGR_SAMPLE_ID=MMETSP0010_2 /ASSEMBLY_ACC=CAM_ASM_000155 /LENGTH=310 /DNA_ID=CAMNT_0000175523 /DNA_START=57 /DNA_END=989 /DNA_ORIENTATION=- /assembly_acc=CAM_ASM_000155